MVATIYNGTYRFVLKRNEKEKWERKWGRKILKNEKKEIEREGQYYNKNRGQTLLGTKYQGRGRAEQVQS
jgi:hypothetical protein